MKKMLIAVFLLLPLNAVAEHMDVIEFEMLEGCPMDQYMAIVQDFNKWGKEYSYQAKIAFPVQSNNLTSMYWLGTSANAATFGKAWDAWRDGLADPDSVPAKLAARFAVCTKNLGRRGYDVF
ncbi:MAG: hypothetical protein OEO71_11070 [Gammaproteobacteria bacterium]|nr:hypothetical protein [Gammaproteobacteria bacterium]